MEICEVTIYTSIDDPEVDNKVVGIKIFDIAARINETKTYITFCFLEA